MAQSRHREDERDDVTGVVLGADQDAPGLGGHHELRSRHDVVAVRAPDLALQAHHRVEVVERVEIAQPHDPSLP